MGYDFRETIETFWEDSELNRTDPFFKDMNGKTRFWMCGWSCAKSDHPHYVLKNPHNTQKTRLTQTTLVCDSEKRCETGITSESPAAAVTLLFGEICSQYTCALGMVEFFREIFLHQVRLSLHEVGNNRLV